MLSYQVFEECCDLPGKHSQVEEPWEDLIIVLIHVAITQILQNLNILLFVLHIGWKRHNQS